MKILDPQGKNLTVDDINKFIQNSASKQNTRGTLGNYQHFNTKHDIFLDKEHLFFANDILFTNDSFKYRKYLKLLKNNEEIQTRNSSVTQENNAEMQGYAEKIKALIGYDGNQNSYWRGSAGAGIGWIIIVIDKYGVVLDVFKYDRTKDYWMPKVPPSGDIYFWNVQNDGVSFAKIARVW